MDPRYPLISTLVRPSSGTAPHLGHLHSVVLADASHRLHQMLGATVTIFSTGTDEHGLKIQQAAFKSGESIQSFCDKNSAKFKKLFCLADVSYTDYIRTTEERHIAAVKHFWHVLKSTNNIYQGKYEGWYCTPEEAFLSDSCVKDIQATDGQIIKVSAETGHPVEWTEEFNYMFPLSKYRSDLLSWIKSGDTVKPRKFGDILIKMLDEQIDDLSISRLRSRLQWGIPVPGDETQTVYVWFDALINYLTVAGYPENLVWPPDVQIIGKDILKFFGIYWPAMLIAAGLEPPRCLLCHSHWTVDHEKMSKSKGNVVDPMVKIQATSVDAIRYFLLREGVPHSDGNYSEQKLINLVNAELADTLGNLLNRCTSSSLNKNQIFPEYSKEAFLRFGTKDAEELIDVAIHLPDEVRTHYLDFNFYRGLEKIMSCLRLSNLYLHERKPWELKDASHQDQLNMILFTILEILRVCGILLYPVTPSLSGRLLDRIGIRSDERKWQHSLAFRSYRGLGKGNFEGKPLGTISGVLFKRIKQESS